MTTNIDQNNRQSVDETPEIVPPEIVSPQPPVHPDDPLLTARSVIDDPLLTANSVIDDTDNMRWRSIQAKANAFAEDMTRSTATFFRQNRLLLSLVGWLILVIVGIRVLFAVLDAIDDLPLMATVLKLIGLVYLGRFTWRYLIKASARQELVQKLDHAKAELLGN